MNPQEPFLPQELVNLATLASEECCPIMGQDQGEAMSESVATGNGHAQSSSSRIPEREFFGAKAPQYVLQQEQAAHRLIIFLKAQGFTNVEIAKQVGVTAVMVAYTVKQPWAQAAIADEIARAGRDAVEVVLKGAALKAALKLESLIDDEKVKSETQRKAAVDVLNRVYGSPTQSIEYSKLDVSKLEDDALDAFIAKDKN